MVTNLLVPNPESAYMVTEKVLPLISAHPVICFHGDLGAGKTTYIKDVCRSLGVESEMSSPTFAIVNEYETNTGETVFHFDLYRLQDPRELLDIGWYDYLDRDCPMLVEWPEVAGDLIPGDAIHVHITAGEGTERNVKIDLPS